jgi:ubiquinone/menaquinone biosynthesis C-methylase UbiE
MEHRELTGKVNVSRLLRGSLTNIAVGDRSVPAMTGHFDPAAPGVGTQFLRDAAIYDARYLDIDGSARKIEHALEHAGAAGLKPKMILDVGSGSGNSVFALAHLFPNTHIVASDLSPDMVAIMCRRAEQRGVDDRVTAIVADASRLEPSPGSFDMIIGSSMLHHLLDPFAALGRLLAGLHPGGLAVFYEPFQAGNLIMRQCLGEIWRRAPYHGDIGPDLVEFIRVLILGLDLMLEEPRVHPILSSLDDKWIFTRKQMNEAALHCGLPAPIISSTNATERTWEDRLSALLRAGMGREHDWPAWVTEVLSSADRHVSPALREELLMEGEVIFRMPD